MAGEVLPEYQPEAGRFDELAGPGGSARPSWQHLAEELWALGPTDLARRQATGERLLEAEGASHLFHEEGGQPWRLDPVPQVVGAAEWAMLERGVRQRTDLLDHVLGDLYGPQRLVREGVIPIEVVAGSARYQQACAGIVPEGVRLALHAVDLIRDDTGRWLVLRDHTDAPAGVGAALLHRSVASQLLPDAHRRLRVESPEPYLAALRAALAALAPGHRDSPRTVVLTPGVVDPWFVEHSYLATRLGYHLAVGGDLVVQHSSLWLRSLTGLEPVDVALRFTPDTGSDPLELRPFGSLGVAGLTQAARAGNVGFANALGSGLASELALAPYLDDACRWLFGEPLVLPSVPSRWCGDPEQLADVLGDPAAFVLFEAGGAPGGIFLDRAPDADAVLARLRRAPHRFSAQRKIRMATTPVCTGGTISPGRTVVRLHVARTRDGATVLPGGQAHVVDTSRPIFTQRGDAAKDVWILGDERTAAAVPVPLLDLPQVDFRSSLTGRAAEALFWLGRNAERAETVSRYARLLLTRYEAIGDPNASASGVEAQAVVMAGLRALSGGTAALADDPPSTAPPTLWSELALAFGSRRGSAFESLEYLVLGAGSVREYMSQTTWRVVASIQRDRAALTGALARRDELALAEALDRIIFGLTAFAGLSTESVVRGPSWRFLDLGRRVERSLQLAALVESTLLTDLPDDAAQHVYELVLAACESLVAYRRQYRSDLQLDALLALLVRDDANPRSLAFQLDRIGSHLYGLPGGAGASLRQLVVTAKESARRDQALDLALLAHGALSRLVEAISATWFTPAEAPRRLRAGGR